MYKNSNENVQLTISKSAFLFAMGIPSASIVVLCLALASAAIENSPLSDSYIDHVNSKQTSWTAGKNFPENTPIEHLNNILGYPLHFRKKDKEAMASLTSIKHDDDIIDNLPESFDAREEWPNCPSLREIRDQSSCGSCWAFSAVEVMTDRVCIFSNGTKNFHFAARDLVSCCTFCGNGCKGGSVYMPWLYWKVDGVVSGGNYNSSQGCMPYTFPPCVHHAPGQKVNPIDNSMPCSEKANYETPECPDKCERSYDVGYKKDKIYGKEITLIRHGEEQMMAEIYLKGPVVAPLDVYRDFYSYKSGVYYPVDDEEIGGHAVKLLGWGVENGTKYWLAANSWNTYWGDNGFFKIRRGQNDCNIEDFATAGEPLLTDY